MKTKTKGKAIAGIAMAAIMLASVFVALVPTGSAVSTGTNFNYINKDIDETVLVGQNVEFWGASVKIEKREEAVWYYYDGPWTDGKAYNVNWDPTLTLRAYDGTNSTSIAVKSPTVPLKLKVGTKEVSTLTLGTNLTIDTGGINIFDNDKVDLEIIGPDGKITEKNGQDFSDITVADLKEFSNTTKLAQKLINTDGWKVGAYTFQIKTKSEYACGLSASSAVKSLTIQKGEVAISAEKTTVTELETIKLTVTGVYGDTIWLNATPSSSHVLFVGGVEDTPSGVAGDNFDDTIDADGKRTYAVKFNDTGSYTIKALVTAGVGKDTSDTVDISVSEKAVTFDMPTTVNIGEKLTIKGTATSGERVTIAVEDTIYDKIERLVIDENGEFSKEIDTTDDCGSLFAVPGSVRLKAYIDKDDKATGTTGATVPTDWSDDGTVVVLMSRGGLTVELSTTSVAQEDDFTLSGVAKGSRNIDILIVAPKGSSGSKIEPGAASLASNIYYESTSVSEIDDTYSKKVTVGANVDTGSYLVVVLSKGSDNKYGLDADELGMDSGDAFYGYSFAAKTQEQVLEILEDALWGAAGSDDLYDVKYVKVAAAVVTLNPVTSVGIGDPLVVTGTTNRKEGFSIVVTCKGPVELTPQTVTVENGTFSATFDTTGATVGTYTVKADDGDGHTDEVTTEILTAVPLTPTPEVEVTPTPTPEVTPTIPPATPTPEPTPTPTPTPGFEAVFAIAGLLAVAYLVQRKRRE